jgi:sarcosine oxidase
MIRQAYFEGEAYVPLLLRAYELWERLERDTEERLLTITGGLMLGRQESSVFAGSLASAQAHGLKHEVLDAVAIRARFPAFRPSAETAGLFEYNAGFLHPERCIRAHLKQAEAHGATLRFDERVLDWTATEAGVRVNTSGGSFEAERLILSAGPWLPELLGSLDLPLTIERNVLYWFDPIGGTEPFRIGRFPVYIWELATGSHFYGFPAVDDGPGGVKVAFFYRGASCSPDTIDRHVSEAEVEAIRAALADTIPALGATLRATATCMYTTAPDHDFVVGLHPEHANVVIASPCSGHGYKFASVMGEVLADLAIDGRSRHGTAMFDVNRFAPRRAGS